MKKALALLSMLTFCAMPVAAQDTVGDAAPPRPVKLMTLESGAGEMTREFYGRVRARETVDLAFQVSGQIVKMPVVEGAPLAKGALIAQLNLTPFQREVERAKIDLDKAERDVARLEQLAGNVVSAVEVRNARTTADLARIRADEARERLDDATLTTQFDALVARREVATFTTVTAGQPVVRLHDMSELRVDISVPEVLFRRAPEGGATFTARFPGKREEYEMVLREFEAETADVAQTYNLTFAFTGEVPDWVLPGSSVTVSGRGVRQGGEQMLIPATAVTFDADRQPGVMVFTPNGGDEAASEGTVAWTPIQMTLRDDTRINLTEGPEPGTEIIAAGASQVRDGQTVRRFTGLAQ